MRIIFIGMLSAAAMGMEDKPDIKPLENAHQTEFQPKGFAEYSREVDAAVASMFRQKDGDIAKRDAAILTLKKEIAEKEAARKAAEEKTAKLTSEIHSQNNQFTQFVRGGKYAKIGKGRKVVTSKRGKGAWGELLSECTVRTGWIELTNASLVEATVQVDLSDARAGLYGHNGHFQLGVVASGYGAVRDRKSEWDDHMGCGPKGWSYQSTGHIYNNRTYAEGSEGLLQLPKEKLKYGERITIRVQDWTVSWIVRKNIRGKLKKVILASQKLPEHLNHIALGVSFRTGLGTSVKIVS